MDVLSLPVVEPTTTTINQQEPKIDLRACTICMEKLDKEYFPHSCFRCENGNICTGCLKNWFLDACRNESKMPPKCCTAIPLAAVRNLLTVAEVELYKAKHEEWSTPDRIYCPVPTCSTFISPKTYTESTKPIESSLLPADWQPIDVSQVSEQTKLPEPATRNVKPIVACPKCCTSICTKCRSFTHTGDCKESDLEPELAAVLKKWRIKRCPKCRAGVRRMFGCAHIECRCGAHFCWVCLSPITTCGGGCEDDGYDDEDEDDGVIAEDDVDGIRGYEGDGNQFGLEPRNENGGAWGCPHYWRPAYRTDVANQKSNLECHRCFREIPPATLSQFTAYQESQKPSSPDPMNVSGEPAWQCTGKHITCDVCNKIAPQDRMDNLTRLWSCECGKACDKCESSEKVVVDEKETKDDYAWDCGCGMTICGDCKEMGL
ncbi:hypothetical protein BGZ60DRAFT_97103 [Tricladium varicosporioides]|nr:hypothetical protein BGZ60DRAFT_97103 [Hymenoscyphus varicosporioides]